MQEVLEVASWPGLASVQEALARNARTIRLPKRGDTSLSTGARRSRFPDS